MMEEDKRIEALDALGVMDSRSEPEFDDIVLIAAELCQTPVSLVSLVHRDRQWFKAHFGFEGCETPIEQSVCAHALHSSALLIIPDLTQDPRTSANTLVTHPPHTRFYAGAPLITAQGIIIGTLCVIDTEPRPEGLTIGQGRALEALARRVVVQLDESARAKAKEDLIRRQRKVYEAVNARAQQGEQIRFTLLENDHRYRAAQAAGRIGIFEIDVDTGTMDVSEEFCRIFGLPASARYPTHRLEALIAPEDRQIRSSVDTRRDGTSIADVEYRIYREDDGQQRWISRRADFVRDDSGKVVKMFGVVQDVTESRSRAERNVALLELGDKLRSLQEIGEIAFSAAEIMARTLGATRAGFGTVDPVEETVLMQPDWRAPGTTSLEGLHHFRDYGSYIDDLKRGNTVVIQDVETDERTRNSASLLLDIGIRVMINLPIIEHRKFVLVVFIHYDRLRRLTPDELDFVRSVGDRTQAAIARVRAEEQQKIVNHELGHRLKNSFAMVQAIANQTLRSMDDQQTIKTFRMRLEALARAHDVLLAENWAPASIRRVISSVLSMVDEDGQRFSISGPEMVVGARCTLSLSLLLHELTTNALKYGALSTNNGNILIGWRVEGLGSNASLILHWQEQGGPPAQAPQHRGFGSRLIGLGLTGTGDAVVSYLQAGFTAEFRAPLSQLSA
jgi:PAS domain S-box-containing protein